MRPALALAALAAVALAPTVQAAPSGQVVDAAILTFSVPTSHGALDVELLAGTAGGSSALYALIGRHGRSLSRYTAPLPSGAFRTDGTRAVLRTRLAGQPLSLTWVVTNGLAVVIGHTDGTDASVEGWHAAGRAASVDVRFGATTCSLPGVLGKGFVEQTDGYGAPLATAPGVQPHGRTCRTIPA